jgi:hypothetical protein
VLVASFAPGTAQTRTRISHSYISKSLLHHHVYSPGRLYIERTQNLARWKEGHCNTCVRIRLWNTCISEFWILRMQGVLNVTSCLFLTEMRFAKIHQRGDKTISPDEVYICSYRELWTKKIAKDSISAVIVSEITATLSGMRNHVFLIPYIPAHKTHRDFFGRNFRKKNNDECILILVIYWNKTGLLHTKISNHNIIYSS